MPDRTRPDTRPDPNRTRPDVDRTASSISSATNAGDRLTIAAAAVRLGISTDAVRKRLARGQLPGEKVGGAWVVFLPRAEESVDRSAPDRTVSSPGPDSDRTATGPDRTASTASTGVDTLIAAKDETIARLDAEVSFLRRELETRTDELQRRDVLLREALARVPQLPAGDHRHDPDDEVSDVPQTDSARPGAPGETTERPKSEPKPDHEPIGPVAWRRASETHRESVITALWRRLFG